MPEVERLWSALCSWLTNLRIALNYLARLTCACGNVGMMVQQAKRIMVSFSRSRSTAIVAELIRDMQVHILSTSPCSLYNVHTLSTYTMYMYITSAVGGYDIG